MQVLTNTKHYTDRQPSAKANGGRSGSDESGALETHSEVECNWHQNNTKGTLQKMYFLDIKKHKGTLGYSTLQNLAGYWKRVKIRRL